jgi:hypothetical protein
VRLLVNSGALNLYWTQHAVKWTAFHFRVLLNVAQPGVIHTHTAQSSQGVNVTSMLQMPLENLFYTHLGGATVPLA